MDYFNKYNIIHLWLLFKSDGFKMHLYSYIGDLQRSVRVKAIEKFEPLLEALSILVDTNRSD